MDARPTAETQAPQPPQAVASPPQPSAPAKPNLRRRQLFILLGAVVLLAAIVWGLYWLLVGSHHVTTNDAYVQADVAQVTPQVSGSIIAAPISDTLPVRKGDVLVVIDPADFQLAVRQAQAALGQAQRRVQGYFANSDAQAGMTAAKAADVAKAAAVLASGQADLARARTDLERRKALAPAGAVSGDELTSAQNRYEVALQTVASDQAALVEARANQTAAAGQEKAAQVLVAGTDVAGNPEVAAAQAKLDQAKLDLERTVIRAPIDGIIAKNNIEVGQRVQTGAQLMTVVPIQTAYVNANFKEVELRRVHDGQPAVLTSDLYGSGVKFHGRVSGLAGGTGSAFAVIPAQNATGNWIKVVQRLPVRINLEPDELIRHPLRVGLSMNVDIDVAR
jgi:membrane fusion protein (multidrug efflux system)